MNNPLSEVPDGPPSASPTAASAGSPAQAVPTALPAEELVAPPANPARVQKRLMKITVGVILVLMAAGIAAGFLFRVDYVAFVPGNSRDTEPFLAVVGTEEYPSVGELHLTTVRVRDHVSLWGYFWYQLDDDAVLLNRSAVFGDLSAEENREVNLERMASSKDLAVAVALEELGYDTVVSDGVFVLETVEGTPARDVLERGDVILSVGDEPVLAPTQLADAIAMLSPGDAITFDVERHSTGIVENVAVVLTSREDDPTKAFLGVSMTERVDLNLDVGFEVTLGSDNIGGPSAGLAFTLAVLDQLTPGELTGGERVAVTGTIQVDGSVGSVGGVEQKAAAVRKAGISTFIIPSALGEDTIARVKERAGSSVNVVPVDDLAGALEVLQGLGGDVNALAEYAAAGGPAS